MGCGACATVCPSGAMRYAYPSVPDLGTRLRTLLVLSMAAAAGAAIAYQPARTWLTDRANP